MHVLAEIVEWSKDRPEWQRDALRRLVRDGELSDTDIVELADLCKSGHGLADAGEASPITKEHVPTAADGSEPVSLVSIFHHRGVNALAEDQTLKFGPALTVVYGDNGAGKTGYIRILKSACRARGEEDILGNVVSGSTPFSPVVSIRYQLPSAKEPIEWDGSGDDPYVSRISVFDTRSAAVYLTEKTDVAFRPFGLDLFDKLVKACRSVRVKLEGERRSLATSSIGELVAKIPRGSAVGELLSGINSLTSPTAVLKLSRLAKQEQERLDLLEKSLLDLQANDPAKLARQLDTRATRARTLARHLREIEDGLSQEKVDAAFQTMSAGRSKAEEAKRLRESTFPEGMLDGTGSEFWSALWEAARDFSCQHAYPKHDYPAIQDEARCVLCQQYIDDPTRARLQQFESFVVSSTERELRDLRNTFARQRDAFSQMEMTTPVVHQILEDLRLESAATADAVTGALATNNARREAVERALSSGIELSSECPDPVSTTDAVEALAEQIETRAKTLREQFNSDARATVEAEVSELRARKLLANNEEKVLDEIERKKKYAAYGLCIDETTTNAITLKSTAVTKTVVSKKLKTSFLGELKRLGFKHIDVELTEAGGAEGVLYHKLVLTRAPGVELPKVVSEGEQRCLSIAAFFAELSTAEDSSGIVFDDPVSSLDYKWREGVAKRLVEEAKVRQVIVFTHDVVFLLLLRQFAGEEQVEQLDQHVRNFPQGAGVCAEELPWVAMPVKKKIGYLKNELQAAAKLFREGHQAAYEKEATYIYGLLREAWERGLEEVLLAALLHV